MICIAVCKKSNSSSAANINFHVIFEAIWDTVHYSVTQP